MHVWCGVRTGGYVAGAGVKLNIHFFSNIYILQLTLYPDVSRVIRPTIRKRVDNSTQYSKRMILNIERIDEQSWLIAF